MPHPDDPLISVLVPAYNRADTLAQCVDSALNNGYDQLEVIIADNGSTDNTLAVANDLAEKDPRVQVIAHPENRGPLPNWRSCLDRAQGKLVHWLWSDDWVETGFYRTLVDGMGQQDAQMGISAARIIDPEAGWSHIAYSFPSRPTSGGEFRKTLMRGGAHSPFSPACALLDRFICNQILGTPIPSCGKLDCEGRAIGADALMLLAAADAAEQVFICPEPLVCFRSHQQSITLSTGQRQILAHYAWARFWWARKRKISTVDQLRDWAYLAMAFAWQALLRAVAYHLSRGYRKHTTP